MTRSSTNTLVPSDQVNIEIEETGKCIENNIDKLINRGEKLSEMKYRAEELKDVGDLFKKKSNESVNHSLVDKLKANPKYFGGGCLFLLILIFTVLITIWIVNITKPKIIPPPIPGNGSNGSNGSNIVCNCLCPPTYGYPWPSPPFPPGNTPTYPPGNTPPPNKPP
jgi:hypothetical protein